ncbi:hypothetical protein HFV06_07220 [Pseudomonas fluorescens]|jgi:hypothetical protein|uniref:hypothetical protein n=1 Tax=Pseudomonas TaxID=286 RepID=UPI000B30317F|nr:MULTISPECIES: hypothetical protein [Pseudomonas]NKI49020.1 hypothetical protein [Pseudomonas fluorescens]MCF5507995.1 hypothetical protein [Pseudomonas sp. PA-3-6H]MCF5515471.1 hypothetical protein [Pseudomonas sp. PA-3-6E]MCF5561149.1 hypothetical protein [Pseudomonas sp. PA-3-5D]MCF5568595.1 hypothetical protein [Pseudomonas sp. PA-3-11C]
MYWLVNLVNGWLRICSVIERLISAIAGLPADGHSVEVLREVAERGGLSSIGRVVPVVGIPGYNPAFAGFFVLTNL